MHNEKGGSTSATVCSFKNRDFGDHSLILTHKRTRKSETHNVFPSEMTFKIILQQYHDYEIHLIRRNVNALVTQFVGAFESFSNSLLDQTFNY